jgi:hypothetical protein
MRKLAMMVLADLKVIQAQGSPEDLQRVHAYMEFVRETIELRGARGIRKHSQRNSERSAESSDSTIHE